MSLTCCDPAPEETTNPDPTPSKPTKVTGLQMSENGLVSWNPSTGADTYSLTYMFENPLITPIELRIADDIKETSFQLPDEENYVNEWLKLYVYAVGKGGKSERSDVLETIWLKGKSLLKTPVIEDVAVYDTTVVRQRGDSLVSRNFKALSYTVGNVDVNTRFIDLSVTVSEKNDSVMAIEKYSFGNNIDKMQKIAEGTFRYTSVTVLSSDFKGDLEIKARTEPDDGTSYVSSKYSEIRTLTVK